MKSAIVLVLALLAVVCLGSEGSFGAPREVTIRTDGVSKTLETISQLLDKSPLLAEAQDLTRLFRSNYSEIVSDQPAAMNAYSTVVDMGVSLFSLSSDNLDAELPALVRDAAKVDSITVTFPTRTSANVIQETEVYNALIHTKNKLEEIIKQRNCSSSGDETCEALKEAVAILVPVIDLWEKQVAPVLIQQKTDIDLFCTNFSAVRTNLGLIQQTPSSFSKLIGLVRDKYDEAHTFLLNFIASNF